MRQPAAVQDVHSMRCCACAQSALHGQVDAQWNDFSGCSRCIKNIFKIYISGYFLKKKYNFKTFRILTYNFKTFTYIFFKKKTLVTIKLGTKKLASICILDRK